MPVPKGFRETKFRGVECSPRSYRIKVVSRRTRLVVCCPKRTVKGKPSWNAKSRRCRVGTRTVAKQTRVS